MEFTRLSDRMMVTTQLQSKDIAEVAGAGFVGIMNNRPDGEEPGQPTSAELEAQAKQHGLAYWHVPILPGQMTETDVRDFAAALRTVEGSVVGFCRTGARATALWKAAQALS